MRDPFRNYDQWKTSAPEEFYFDGWTCGECNTWNDAPEDESEWDSLICSKCGTKLPNPIEADYNPEDDLYQDSFGDTK